jgi:hypothetical protein
MADETQGGSLESFVDQILFEKNADSLSPEVRQEMKNDLLERVERRVNAAVVAALPSEKAEEFEKLVETASGEEIQAYCQKNIPDIEGVIAKELLEFKALYQSV